MIKDGESKDGYVFYDISYIEKEVRFIFRVSTAFCVLGPY